MSWSRLVGQILGHTAQSAALVLAAYMAGLALGYLLASRLAVARPLRAYGFAEIVAALGAAVVPWSLRLLEGANVGGAGLRFLFCFVVMLPATVAMGATLPFMAEWLERDGTGRGRRVAAFYGLNTAGALTGVAASLAFLLLWVGVRGSTYLAAAISVSCGLIALYLARAERSPAVEPSEEPEPAWVPRWTVAVALTGFGVMGLEVLYTRLFALAFHNSTYTFGLVVTVALCSLACGAWAVGAVRAALPSLVRAAAVAASLAVPLSVSLFLLAGGLDYFQWGTGFGAYMVGAVGFVALVAAPPLAAMGVVLPASWRFVGADGRVGGRVVGRLTTVSTLAGVAGALLTSFVLLPVLGLWWSFAALAALPLMTAILLLGGLAFRRRSLVFLLLSTAAAGGLALLSLQRHAPEALARDSEIVRRLEGAYGWTDLRREAESGHGSIVQNLHYSLGSSKPMARELWQGDLPLLLHPEPQEVAFLGMGTGITASSALDHADVERIVVMELIPEVVEAARWLGPENGELLNDPRVVLELDDARHSLKDRGWRYDVVVSDLFVPWESRTGYLYTVEHYRLVRASLQPGGLFCQWLALYQVGESELESILEAFATVFPTTTVWWGDTSRRWPLVCIMGSEAPLEVDLASIAARQEALSTREEPRMTSHQPPLAQYLGDWRPSGLERLNTDEHPWVEFRAPLAHRDARLIQDGRLDAFYEAVLSQLSRDGVRVSRAGEPAALPELRPPSRFCSQ